MSDSAADGGSGAALAALARAARSSALVEALPQVVLLLPPPSPVTPSNNTWAALAAPRAPACKGIPRRRRQGCGCRSAHSLSQRSRLPHRDPPGPSSLHPWQLRRRLLPQHVSPASTSHCVSQQLVGGPHQALATHADGESTHAIVSGPAHSIHRPPRCRLQLLAVIAASSSSSSSTEPAASSANTVGGVQR